jgi:hypothetical protein
MLIIVRNEEKLSQKTNFIAQLAIKNLNQDVISVFRRESQKFIEKQSLNEIQLRASKKSILVNYLLMFIKSPKDLRNGLIFRLFSFKRKNVLTGHGFLSTLSSILYLRFGTSAESSSLMDCLKLEHSPKIFVIDEFVSLNCLNIKKLKALGSIIYVSQDIAFKRFGFADNVVTRDLMFRLERDALNSFSLVIACSEMERLKYLEMGASNAVFYPNIYPISGFKTLEKDALPSVSIVLKGHWGPKAEKSLQDVFSALANINRQIKVYMIGINPENVPNNVILDYTSFIPSKLDYLELLSKSWIGLNIGVHEAGTNERKYDYAAAGLVVISDSLGARGDLLTHEYTYIDRYDLSAKIGQLIGFGKERLAQMGTENRRIAIDIAENARVKLLNSLKELAFNT